MAVTIKSKKEIELMRESGRILAEVHARLGKAIEPGISTWDINAMGEELIRGFGCVPNFLNYNGYPASIPWTVIIFMTYPMQLMLTADGLIMVW